MHGTTNIKYNKPIYDDAWKHKNQKYYYFVCSAAVRIPERKARHYTPTSCKCQEFVEPHLHSSYIVSSAT